MKIEKLNDNQIRCTLTHADLAARHLKLSELAYGTEKAKSLFRDMMEQASFDFGFEADNIPLMIEAVPVSSDTIVLIITKVEDPEELDTRFSKFTSAGDGGTDPYETFSKLEGADDLLDLLDKVKSAAADVSPSTEKASDSPDVRLYSFENIDSVIRMARLMDTLYQGANTLYRDPSNGVYVLALTRSDYTDNSFSKICNMLSEYGSPEKTAPEVLAFLEEHCETIVSADAIHRLARL